MRGTPRSRPRLRLLGLRSQGLLLALSGVGVAGSGAAPRAGTGGGRASALAEARAEAEVDVACPADEVGWQLVRRALGGAHSARDALQGTEVYGNLDGPGNGPLGTTAFSVHFESAVPGWDEVLLSTGLCNHWMVMARNAAIGEWYDGTLTEVMRSHTSPSTVYAVTSYRRSNSPEDPWLQYESDHNQCSALYVGDNYDACDGNGEGHLYGGLNVYIRRVSQLATGLAASHLQTTSERCHCFDQKWVRFGEYVRSVFSLAPGQKYTGNFSEVDLEIPFVASAHLVLEELNRDERHKSNAFFRRQVRTGNTACPPGLASAAVITFVRDARASVDGTGRTVETYRALLQEAMEPVVGYGDGASCKDAPDWIFDCEDVIHNIMQHKRIPHEGSRFEWSQRAAVDAPEVYAYCERTEDSVVDACCEAPEWAEFERNLAGIFSHPRWGEIPLPQYRNLVERFSSFDMRSWEFHFPWVFDCETGLLAFRLASIVNQGSVGIPDWNTKLLLVRLFGRFSLEELARSRFPLFGLLARVLAVDVSISTPPACAGDLVQYMHAALGGGVPRDGHTQRVAAQAIDSASLAIEDSNALDIVCLEQLALTSSLLKRFAFISRGKEDVDLLGQPFTGQRTWSWIEPTSLPIWHALHALWPQSSSKSLERAAGPWSSASRLLPRGFDGVLARLALLDFNGWELPSDRPSQDDAWTVVLHAELDRRQAEKERNPGQKLRVALLEAHIDQLNGLLNMMRGDLETKDPTWRKGPVVYNRYFKYMWELFVANPEEINSAPVFGKMMGSFDAQAFSLLLAWSADFVAWPSRPSGEDMKQLEAYDLLVVLNPFPAGHPPTLPPVHGQVRLWMPWEPYSLLGAVALPEDYCPVVLDQFAVVPSSGATFPSAVLWHYYQVADWQRIISGSKVEVGDAPRVFVFYYDASSPLSLALQSAGYEVSHKKTGASKVDFWRELQRSSIAILPDRLAVARRSCGQVIADAAMARCIPTFAPRSKLFARLLSPSFLSYRSQEELIAKLVLLRHHPEWLNLLSKDLCHRLRFVDAGEAESAAHLLRRAAKYAPGDRRCSLPA